MCGLPSLQALTSDPNFLRISKGAYSLHCFHPDKEQLVKAKKRKMSDHFAGEEWRLVCRLGVLIFSQPS